MAENGSSLHLSLYTINCLEWLRKSTKNLRIVGVPAEIRTGYLSSTSEVSCSITLNRTTLIERRTKELKRYSELLGFRNSCIVQCSKKKRTQRPGNCICFRPRVREGTPTLLSPLERAKQSSD